MTVVWPSPTRTVVLARCVLIEMEPLAVGGFGDPLSTEICMITVFAAAGPLLVTDTVIVKS